jgi:manganese-transporting P-type ATPase
MMYSGLFIAIVFLFISRSKPLETLSSERPHSSIFSPYVLLSIIGQFILNLTCLIYLSTFAKTFLEDTVMNADTEFKPNILNSVVFLVSTTQTLFTFFNNYKGHPFMESLTENRGLGAMLSVASFGMLILILEVSPELNLLMELTPLPILFKKTFYLVLFLNIFIGYLYETILVRIFKK